MTKTHTEIKTELANANQVFCGEAGRKCYGLSYEEGVIAALDWVLGNEPSPPIEMD